MAGVALMALDGALGSVLVAGDATNLWLVVPFCHLVGKPYLYQTCPISKDTSSFCFPIFPFENEFPI
jgi:hypothetical protein